MKIRPQHLRAVRERNGHTQSSLAETLGLSRQRLNYLENSDPPVGILPSTAKRLAEVLGCDIEDIAEIEEPVA